jgi:hypothetical protein
MNASTQPGRNQVSAGKTYEEANWDRLSPTFREKHNRLREARGLPPIPPPEIDLHVPAKAVKPVLRVPSEEDTKQAAEELGLPHVMLRLPDGLGGEIILQIWPGELDDDIAYDLASAKAQRQLRQGRKQGQNFRTKIWYATITKFVAIVECERGQSRKQAIYEAACHFNISVRTVETAISRSSAEPEPPSCVRVGAHNCVGMTGWGEAVVFLDDPRTIRCTRCNYSRQLTDVEMQKTQSSSKA